jgi:hypothetical protein
MIARILESSSTWPADWGPMTFSIMPPRDPDDDDEDDDEDEDDDNQPDDPAVVREPDEE